MDLLTWAMEQVTPHRGERVQMKTQPSIFPSPFQLKERVFQRGSMDFLSPLAKKKARLSFRRSTLRGEVFITILPKTRCGSKLKISNSINQLSGSSMNLLIRRRMV